MKRAKEVEEKTLRLQGEKSERLIEIYSLYSFFEFQAGNTEAGMQQQRKAS